MKKEIENWFTLAVDDLDTAKKILPLGKYHVASLFSQQAAEKALKALYIYDFKELKKTHDLFFLATKLNLPENYKSICKTLSPLYIEARYPDISGKLPSLLYSKIDAENFIKIAEEIILWVRKKFS